MLVIEFGNTLYSQIGGGVTDLRIFQELAALLFYKCNYNFATPHLVIIRWNV